MQRPDDHVVKKCLYVYAKEREKQTANDVDDYDKIDIKVTGLFVDDAFQRSR